MGKIIPSPKLVLASGSPRRRELLAEAGYDFIVRAPSAEAESDAGQDEAPRELVARLARQKAGDVVARCHAEEPGRLVVACDTVAVCGDQILGKPAGRSEAAAMLRLLRGREHEVISGLCVWPLDGRPADVRVAVTRLRMDRLSDAELQDYVASGAWQGKAGAFGYQDRLGWVHIVEGSETNVVGLPMELLCEMLYGFTA